MPNNLHLTFDERQIMGVSLHNNLKCKEIGESQGKDSPNPCADRRRCKHLGGICKKPSLCAKTVQALSVSGRRYEN